jgi:hypothetical protein
MTFFYYVVKDLRQLHSDYVRERVEPTLREWGVTWFVDIDPKDWKNVQLY